MRNSCLLLILSRSWKCLRWFYISKLLLYIDDVSLVFRFYECRPHVWSNTVWIQRNYFNLGRSPSTSFLSNHSVFRFYVWLHSFLIPIFKKILIQIQGIHLKNVCIFSVKDAQSALFEIPHWEKSTDQRNLRAQLYEDRLILAVGEI